MKKITWWHRISLGDGIITPGVCRHGADDEDYASARFGLPVTLKGKSVLDIGAWDGYFSFEAERRGAQPVLAADLVQEPGGIADAHGSTGNWGHNEGFLFAKQVLRSAVEFVNIGIYDIDAFLSKSGTLYPPAFDYVFFFGVLYHLKEPLLALEKLSAVTREIALVETACSETKGCTMSFQPGHEHDPTNLWYPTRECLGAMLLYAGFQHVEFIANPPGRTTVRAYKTFEQGRTADPAPLLLNQEEQPIRWQHVTALLRQFGRQKLRRITGRDRQ